MSAAGTVCSDTECDVAKSGVCRLKHDPIETCPNYQAGTEHLDESELSKSGSSNRPVISIASGDVMHIDELRRFAMERQIIQIALVSEQKAGKTTLLASLYERFCRGPFAGFTFVGSRTLVGFAKRHHLALLSSGNLEPETPRTSRSDPVAYFHLRIKGADGVIRDLIISDRSGEVYGDARVDTTLIPALEELPLARRICFLLDGARLGAKATRSAYARQFKQMMHALYDNGGLKHADHIEVLVTKFDVTSTHADAVALASYLDQYERQLITEFAEKGLAVECFKICALPKKDRTIGFKGLDALLQRWAAPKPLPSVLPADLPSANRQIDRLSSKPLDAQP